MRFLRTYRGWLLGLLLAVQALSLAGCGTVEGDARNSSQRPWNTPKSWETGMPGGLMEGR